MTAIPNQKRTIQIKEEADISVAIDAVLQLAFGMGMNKVNRTMLATSVSELATNIFRYADQGYIDISFMEGEVHQGIKVIARDEGPGIADIDLAMKDGFSTTKSMGVGLPGVERMSDTFAIESKLGQGTIVTVEKFL